MSDQGSGGGKNGKSNENSMRHLGGQGLRLLNVRVSIIISLMAPSLKKKKRRGEEKRRVGPAEKESYFNAGLRKTSKSPVLHMAF